MALSSPFFRLALLEGTGYIWEKQQTESLYTWELVVSRRIDLIAHLSPGAGYTMMKPESRYRWLGILVDINWIKMQNRGRKFGHRFMNSTRLLAHMAYHL
jgi:hypothetical protein